MKVIPWKRACNCSCSIISSRNGSIQAPVLLLNSRHLSSSSSSLNSKNRHSQPVSGLFASAINDESSSTTPSSSASPKINQDDVASTTINPTPTTPPTVQEYLQSTQLNDIMPPKKLVEMFVTEKRDLSIEKIEKILSSLLQDLKTRGDVADSTQQTIFNLCSQNSEYLRDIGVLISKRSSHAILLSYHLFHQAYTLHENLNAGYALVRLLTSQHHLLQLLQIPKSRSIELLEELAIKGHPGSKCTLGVYYCNRAITTSNNNNNNSKTEFRKGLSLLKEAESLNVAEAARQLGHLYLHGVQVRQDLPQAFHYFTRGHELGNIESTFYLGTFYSTNTIKTIPLDEPVLEPAIKAFEYFTIAANKGLGVAQHNLAEYYLQGPPEPTSANKNGKSITYPWSKDIRKAVEYWQMAAMEGVGLSMLNLGKVYYEGFGDVVRVDLDKAKKYLEMVLKGAQQPEELKNEAKALLELVEVKRKEMKKGGGCSVM